MRVHIEGIQAVDYVSRKTNKQVTGTTFHVTYSEKEVNGLACERIFVSSRSAIDGLEDIAIGDEVELAYNRYGSIDTMSVVK